mmetsp:Transcript_16242/g.24547  ORF Transcript_16242/g.24547 Transcript_16242/m.24547 type:complete len:214 (+) Transcript_16242:237-878(+)
MKRKHPVNLALLGSDPSSTKMHFIAINPAPSNDQNSLRVCTPSPTYSSEGMRMTQTKRTASIIRRSKRRKFAKYKTCKELIDWEVDSSIATDYEIILFSHMIMEEDHYPSFRCRLCPKSRSSTFCCQTIGDFVSKIPFVENHLMECEASPSWLGKSLNIARAKHKTQKCARKPYASIVWKRVLTHAFYSRLGNAKRVKFAHQLCKEHVIPGRI